MLVGPAGKSDELASVLSELVGRDGIALELERHRTFHASALLSGSEGDSRVWVFVTVPERHVAKLFFRGPLGRRFLLRRLALKSGLDELGRELIAQVVETSAVALLRSEVGVSREEVRADLSAEGERDEEGREEEVGARDTSRSEHVGAEGGAGEPVDGSGGRGPLELAIAARGVAKWAGGDLGLGHGPGLEATLALRRARGLIVGSRVEAELDLGQHLETNGLDAVVSATSLRAGLDVGTSAGASAFTLGVLAGVDLTRIAPKASTEQTLVPAPESTGTVPVIRLEARYELTLGALRVTTGLFVDASLKDTSYDVQDASGEHRVAAPWPVHPGLALTLGGRTAL